MSGARLPFSRIADRWLPWLAGAVLVAGIAFFAVSRLGGGSTPVAAPAQRPVPLDPRARRVAFRFVDTAVARRRLADAYRLVTPRLRDGMTLSKWTSGTIPVTPYPVADAAQRWHVLGSYPGRAQLEVAFVPKAGSAAQAEVFAVGLVESRGRWLVDAWTPRSGIQAPSG